MSEYKRLTKKGTTYVTNDGEHDIIVQISADNSEQPLYDLEDICSKLNRLAELEDKIESVLWVELPCKVGDVFFGFPNKTDAPNQYFKYTVKGIEYRQDGVYLRTNYDMCFKYGDEAFMTEAEARLKELKGEK